MDMSVAFDEEVRAECPRAEIVYDLFHVVAKYGREVIDRVRADEANRLRHDLLLPQGQGRLPRNHRMNQNIFRLPLDNSRRPLRKTRTASLTFRLITPRMRQVRRNRRLCPWKPTPSFERTKRQVCRSKTRGLYSPHATRTAAPSHP